MRFWDSSAILPLTTEERRTEAVRALFDQDREMVVAWFTPVEVSSALWRRWRENRQDSERDVAIERLRDIEDSWLAIFEPHPVATLATALFQRHALKAADALQLATAIFAAEELGNLPFVTLDQRLAIAAKAEGFTLLP